MLFQECSELWVVGDHLTFDKRYIAKGLEAQNCPFHLPLAQPAGKVSMSVEMGTAQW